MKHAIDLLNHEAGIIERQAIEAREAKRYAWALTMYEVARNLRKYANVIERGHAGAISGEPRADVRATDNSERAWYLRGREDGAADVEREIASFLRTTSLSPNKWDAAIESGEWRKS